MRAPKPAAPTQLSSLSGKSPRTPRACSSFPAGCCALPDPWTPWAGCNGRSPHPHNLPSPWWWPTATWGSTNWAGLQLGGEAKPGAKWILCALRWSARAMREQNLSTAAKAEWSKAFKPLAGRPGPPGESRTPDRRLELARRTRGSLWPSSTSSPRRRRGADVISTPIRDGQDALPADAYAQEISPTQKPGVKNNWPPLRCCSTLRSTSRTNCPRGVRRQKEESLLRLHLRLSLFLQKKTAEAAEGHGTRSSRSIWSNRRSRATTE